MLKKQATLKTNMLHNQEESYMLNGAAMHVYNTLGPGFLEAVYQEAFAIELPKRDLPFQRAKALKIYYHGQELKQPGRAGVVCVGDIIVQLKAVSQLEGSHRSHV